MKGAPVIPSPDHRRVPSSWQKDLEKQLEPLLGDFTARMALRTAALKVAKCTPEELNPSDLPVLLDGLRPMLNVFLGAERAKGVLQQLAAAVGIP